MSFKLEDLPYQRQAISAVVRLFDGQQPNYFDLQLQGDCFPNRLDLTRQEIIANLEKIAAENGISRGEASICIHPDYCIEMETGTGKTLVYLRTIYELCREYGFTKFIILVPSVPNTVFEVRDPRRTALVCLAWNESIKDGTIKRLREIAEAGEAPFFICLERSLSTTSKWNLRHFLGKHFNAF
jgi:hypothetical protein